MAVDTSVVTNTLVDATKTYDAIGASAASFSSNFVQSFTAQDALVGTMLENDLAELNATYDISERQMTYYDDLQAAKHLSSVTRKTNESADRMFDKINPLKEESDLLLARKGLADSKHQLETFQPLADAKYESDMAVYETSIVQSESNRITAETNIVEQRRQEANDVLNATIESELGPIFVRHGLGSLEEYNAIKLTPGSYDLMSSVIEEAKSDPNVSSSAYAKIVRDKKVLLGNIYHKIPHSAWVAMDAMSPEARDDKLRELGAAGFPVTESMFQDMKEEYPLNADEVDNPAPTEPTPLNDKFVPPRPDAVPANQPAVQEPQPVITEASSPDPVVAPDTTTTTVDGTKTSEVPAVSDKPAVPALVTLESGVVNTGDSRTPYDFATNQPPEKGIILDNAVRDNASVLQGITDSSGAKGPAALLKTGDVVTAVDLVESVRISTSDAASMLASADKLSAVGSRMREMFGEDAAYKSDNPAQAYAAMHADKVVGEIAKRLEKSNAPNAIASHKEFVAEFEKTRLERGPIRRFLGNRSKAAVVARNPALIDTLRAAKVISPQQAERLRNPKNSGFSNYRDAVKFEEDMDRYLANPNAFYEGLVGSLKLGIGGGGV